ncbi:MAG: tyrosine-type recombinase/integrase [Polyangiaceae bacterium]|nr:tyrosine-type recombinase/integrase [Polyangiaceae bacterium]
MRPTGKRMKPRAFGDGLYLAFNPQSLVWTFRYLSPVTHKRATTTIGKPPAMSLADARREAFRLRDLVLAKRDPAIERADQRAADRETFQAVSLKWDEARALLGKVTDKTRKTAMRRLELYVWPTIGSRPIQSLQRRDLLPVLDNVIKGCTLEGYDRRTTTDRVRQILKQVFDYAIDEEILSEGSNPAARLRKYYAPREQRHFAAVTAPAEIGALMRAIDDYRGRFTTCMALRLQPLVMLRPGELRGAEWTEIELDGDAPTWRIPGERMKIKEHGEHVIPLSRQAVAILRELRAVNRGQYVFPAQRGATKGVTLSDGALNKALDNLGYDGKNSPKPKHRSHGFRSTALTHLNRLVADGGQSFNAECVELQLAHNEKTSTRSAYQRDALLPQRRVMMQVWADELDRMRALSPLDEPAGAATSRREDDDTTTTTERGAA